MFSAKAPTVSRVLICVSILAASLASAGGGRRAGAEPGDPCPQAENDRARQCLQGPVWIVVPTVARFTRGSDGWVEAERHPTWLEPSAVFNPGGALAEQVVHEHDGAIRNNHVYVYDEQNRLSEILTLTGDGALQGKIAFGYDGRDRRIRELRYDPDGKLLAATEYAYDVLNRVVEENVYNETGTFVMRVAHTYDDEGNRIRTARHTPPDVRLPDPVSTTYRFDGHGRVVEERQHTAQGRLFERTEMTYDDCGRPATEARYGADGAPLGTIVYAYEDDAHGNWVRRVRSHSLGKADARPLDVTYRNITYFEERRGYARHR